MSNREAAGLQPKRSVTQQFGPKKKAGKSGKGGKSGGLVSEFNKVLRDL